MTERPGPNIFSIPAHRGFADALAAGLIARYSEPHFGLARLTLLLPSSRAGRAVTEAFVRLSEGGLLLPRMAMVGDLDLDETLGPLFDTLGSGADVPPAAQPMQRLLILADLLAKVEAQAGVAPQGKGAVALRRAFDIGRTIDRLLVEGIDADTLKDESVTGIVGELSAHWQKSSETFASVQGLWCQELGRRGEVDAPIRRNLLFESAARRWRADPPAQSIVAAGVTSASPALAALLRVVADLPKGAVVLPDLDLALDAEVWDALGRAGKAEAVGDAPLGPRDAVTHPQYHLKLLLNRMGIARDEVQPWLRAGLAAAPPARSRAISNLFLPPAASGRWVDLPADERRLAGVRLMESAHPGDEAVAIAILLREALEAPQKRAALITPDRALAARVVAQLERWGIAADDTAGQPLHQTAAGRLALLLAEVLAEDAAPVPLIALLTHPLVRRGEDRAHWLEQARRFDLALRGPRPAAGLAALGALAGEQRLADWWQQAETVLAPLFALTAEAGLARLVEALSAAAEQLCGESLWGNVDGRALAAFLEELRLAAEAVPGPFDPRELHAVLRDAMDRVSVRPPWGGHPRLAIYGLLEARMARADLMICGGLVEGVWPGTPAPDPLLPPAVLRALGVPGADFRIGLAAHDLAAVLGAPEVVLSWARRDAGGPVLPSRFVLRIRAMLGDQLGKHLEVEAPRLAKAIDDAPPAPRYPRPRPLPGAEQRLVDLSATGLDRLRSDPYQFYANAILRLRALDPLDSEPSAAWRGEAVHKILENWHKAGNQPGELTAIADQTLRDMNAHPLMRGLWRPRLMAALAWIDRRVIELASDGRQVVASEVWGDMRVQDVRVLGRADRIDRLADGSLAIVDYKTGSPPSRAMVKQGYALQLGVIGLIAASGGFDVAKGDPQEFEYWSLARDKASKTVDGFGYVASPFKTAKADGVEKEDFLAASEGYLNEAIARWIKGGDPFTARLNLDVPVYNDYDQLMRLDEWLPRLTPEEANEA